MSKRKSFVMRFLASFMVIAVIIISIPVSLWILAAETATAVIHTVTINYVYEDSGSMVAQPYTIKLREGRSFTKTIDLVEQSGFAVSADSITAAAEKGAEVDTANKQLRITITDIQEDINIVLYYTAGQQSYTVNHHYQNINDDNYDSDQPAVTETKTGKVGTMTEAEEVSATGFTCLGVTQTQIASDGSTVVDIYYVRNYYTVIFDINGGVGTPEQIYAKYGSNYTKPSPDPTKSGYSFGGWFNTAENRWFSDYLTNGQATVTKDITFTASWTAGTTSSVTIYYYGEKANDNGFESLHKTTLNLAVDSQIGVNYDDVKNSLQNNSNVDLSVYDTSFYYNNPEFNRSQTAPITVQADSTQNVLHAYLKRKTATVTFRNNAGTSTYGTITAKAGQDITSQYQAIQNIVRNAVGSYVWAANPNSTGSVAFRVDFYTMTSQDTTWYAYPLSASSTVNYYVVWQNANGGQEKRETHVLPNVGQNYYAGGAPYGLTGYTFSKYEGWTYPNGSPVTLTGSALNNMSVIINNATFYYTRNSDYNVVLVSGENEYYTRKGAVYGTSFNSSNAFNSFKNDGIIGRVEGVDGKVWDYGLLASRRPQNMPEDSLFAGWFLDPDYKTEISLVNMTITGNTTVFGKWVKPTYTVNTYTDSSLSGAPTSTQTITYSETATAMSAPVQAGKVFQGWFYMENGIEKAFSFSLPITKNYNLYPKYSAQVEVGYTVKYLEQGTNRELATATTGTALIGNPLTVKALSNDDLNLVADTSTIPYYYPDEGSKTITLNQDETQNVITFYYSQPNPITYKVRYVEVDDQGNEIKVLGESGQKSTTDAVVTEVYQIFDGYQPKQYSIAFVLTSNVSKNVITFAYTAIPEEDSTIECQYLVAIPANVLFTEDNLSQTMEISLVSDNEVRLPDDLSVTVTASSANNANLIYLSGGGGVLTDLQAPYTITWSNGQILNTQNARDVLAAQFAFTGGTNTNRVTELMQTGTATLPVDSAAMLKAAKSGMAFADMVTFYVNDNTPSNK